MRTRICGFLAAVLLLSSVTVLASDAGAAPRHHRYRAEALLRSQTFAATGTFTGALGGELRIGGESYRVSTDATVYEPGRGPLPLGSWIDGRVLYVTGVRMGGSAIVGSIIVRPLESVIAGGDMSQYVREETPSAR